MSIRTTFAKTMPIGIGAALCVTGVLAQGTVPLAPGPHDALAAAGPQAAQIGQLWNLFLAICTAVFVAILAALGWALRRAPRANRDSAPDLSMTHRHEGGRPHIPIFVAEQSLDPVLVGLTGMSGKRIRPGDSPIGP